MKIKVIPEIKFLRVESATEMELAQLKISLTKEVDGWAFKKKFFNGWDGKVCFIQNNLIPFGLWNEVVEICKKYKYPLEIEGLNECIDYELTLEEFTDWVNEQFEGNTYKPRDYQIETAWKIIKYKACLGELATSAGKTLITFIVFAYLIKKLGIERILMVVPNISLVEQADGDFYDYNDPKIIDYSLQMIYSGKKIKKDSNIVVGTYQSLVKKPAEFFKQFGAVCVDECLHPNTLITMADGKTKKIKDVKVGDLVITTNDDTLSKEIREVDYVYHNLSIGEQMFEIELENSEKIKITGNHKVKLINGTYKRADDVLLEDKILMKNNENLSIKSITGIPYKGEVYNLRINSPNGLNHNYFANGINVANCHKAKSTSIKTILQKCSHTFIKFGVSGTIPKAGTLDRMTIMSHTGPIVQEVGTKFLIDKGHVTPVEVKVLKLDYAPNEVKEAFYNASKSRDATKMFKLEKDYIIENTDRLEFVTDVISSTNKNSLVLFHRTTHGKKLLSKLKRKDPEKTILYIDGSTPAEIREEYKRKMEESETVEESCKIFHFDGYTITVPNDDFVKLTNGKKVRAKDLKIGDDVCDEFLASYKKD